MQRSDQESSTEGLPTSAKARSTFLEYLWPPGRSADRFFWPKSLGSRIALLICIAAVGTYLFFWVKGHWAVLTDTNLQTDDARTALFPFHRWDDGAPLADDPVANEMIGFTPPALRLLYAGLVKSSNLFVAMKVVQAISFLIVLFAGVWLARRRRAGWAAGALLVFLIFHTRGLVGGTIGGMTRGFVVPILTVWTAGVIGGSKRMRYGAVILGALTHPSVMALLLATEGILALRFSRTLLRDTALRKSLVRYACLVVVSLAIAIPYSKDQESRVGRPFTVEEAEKEGCLGPGGRARHLPFGDPTSSAAKRFTAIFAVDDDKEDDRPGLASGKPVPGAFEAFKKLDNTGALLIFAAIFALGAMRLAPLPRAAAALFAATFITYWLARVFAFRMYAPARFFQYGMPFIAVLVAVSGLAQVAPRLRRTSRDLLRVGIACVLGLSLIAWTGDGIVPRNGVSLDRRNDREMYDFVASLPSSIRVASHPSDGDDLPLWAARATVCGFETLQPWWVGHWARGKERAQDTLAAMYAVDRNALFAYCEKYGVTHILVRGDRYRDDFKKRAMLFEPLGAYVTKLLAPIERRDLLLATPPADAVIYKLRSYSLVDVQKLKEVWADAGGPKEKVETGRSR